MNRKNEFLLRVYSVLLFFIISAAILLTRVININIHEGERWRAAGDSLYVKYIPVEAERGNILDAQGNLLATALQIFDIRMDLNSSAMTDETFMANVDSLAICLSKHLKSEMNPQQYKNYLIKKRREGERYLLIAKNISYSEMKTLKSFPLFRLGRFKGGFIVESQNKRVKPFRQLAGRTIGTFRQNAPLVGLEASFNDLLAGEDGRQLKQRVAPGTWIPVNDLLEIEPRRGVDVKTTLDMDIQDVVQNALLGTLEHHEADYGVAVVMEVETGAVKAICNLKKVEGGYAEIFNDAVGSAVEPGSTIKLATVMALLEDDLVTLDEKVRLDGGVGTFCGKRLEDSKLHEYEFATVQQAFEISSNVGMARLVETKYKARDNEQMFIDRLKQFHLDQPTGIEIKGEGKPYIKDAGDVENHWSCLSLPWMSIGYELQITPLQLLTFYNAVANNGRMMKPYLVSELISKQKVIKKFQPKVVDPQIARPETIAKVRMLMEGVVKRGTAEKIQSEYLDFAGKTGTAQVNYGKGKGKMQYQASFAGYFPANNPKYSCLVMVRNPRKNGFYGGTVAGTVFKQVAEKCLGIESLRESGPRNDSIPQIASEEKYPVYQVAYRRDVKSILDYSGARYRDRADEDYIIVMAEGDSLAIKKRSIDKHNVPNVVSMSLKDALYILENRGLKTKFSGSGRVSAQSLPAGTPIEDEEIVLTLK